MTTRQHLILIHGGGVGPWMWDGIARELGDEVTVHTPVLPGHEQDGSGHLTSHAAAAQAVAEQVGLAGLSGPITVLGFSFGSQIAVTLAAAFPARISRLIVMSGLMRPLSGPMRALVTLSTAVAAPLTNMPKFAQAQAQALGVPPQQLPQYLELSAALSGHTLRRMAELNASFQAPEEVWSDSRPTTLWFGTREIKALVQGMEEIAASHPQLERVAWEGGTHATALSDPVGYARELRRMLL